MFCAPRLKLGCHGARARGQAQVLPRAGPVRSRRDEEISVGFAAQTRLVGSWSLSRWEVLGRRRSSSASSRLVRPRWPLWVIGRYSGARSTEPTSASSSTTWRSRRSVPSRFHFLSGRIAYVNTWNPIACCWRSTRRAILDDRSQLTDTSLRGSSRASFAVWRVSRHLQGSNPRGPLRTGIDDRCRATLDREILAFLDEWGLNAIGRIAQRRSWKSPRAIRLPFGSSPACSSRRRKMGRDDREVVAVDVHDDDSPAGEPPREGPWLLVHHLGEAELPSL